MNVRDTIALAQEWVDQEATRLPHFMGAHLMGSLATLPGDTPFPAYRDIDVAIVVAGDQDGDVHDLPYRVGIVEYGLANWRHYESAAAVLRDPGLAPNLVANTILADPQGVLAPMHTVVAAQFPQRPWVQARCAAMRQEVAAARAMLEGCNTALEAYGALIGLSWSLAGWLAVAALRPPTHRRSLIRQQEILAQQEALPLHEAALALLGVEHFDTRQVESYLAAAVAAFDRAVAVHRTPTPLDFKLQAHVRPYLAQGSQEMIDAGYPREAMAWIGAGLRLAHGTIQLDDPVDAERQQVQAYVDHLLEDCGLRAPGALRQRQAAADRLIADLATVVERLVATNPAVRDPQSRQAGHERGSGGKEQ
jgi:hypothetical protein